MNRDSADDRAKRTPGGKTAARSKETLVTIVGRRETIGARRNHAASAVGPHRCWSFEPRKINVFYLADNRVVSGVAARRVRESQRIGGLRWNDSLTLRYNPRDSTLPLSSGVRLGPYEVLSLVVDVGYLIKTRSRSQLSTCRSRQRQHRCGGYYRLHGVDVSADHDDRFGDGVWYRCGWRGEGGDDHGPSL